MSVINQMLRDLDKQQRQQTTTPAARVAPPPFATSTKVWALVAILLLVIIGQQLWLSPVKPTTVETPAVKPMAVVTVPRPVMDTDATNKTASTTSDNHANDVTLPNKSNLETPSTTAAIVNTPPPQTALPADTGEIPVETEQTVRHAEVVAALPSSVEVTNSADAEAIIESNIDVQTDEGTVNVQRVSPAQHWQQQVAVALAEGRDQEAELLLRQWRLVDPQQALPLLAELFWQRQQPAPLDAVLAEAQTLALEDVRLTRLSLYRLQQQQRWPELLAAINPEVVNRYGAEVIALQAQALWQTQQYPDALMAYQQWTAMAPTEARAWLGQALVLEQLAQPQQARMAYQQAQQLGGLSPASLQFIQQRLVALPE